MAAIEQMGERKARNRIKNPEAKAEKETELRVRDM